MKRFSLAVILGMVMLISGLVSSPALAVADWTIMVFLNADNNLDSFGVSDMNEMEKIGSTGRVNIVVQIDREHGPAKRYLIRKDSSGSVSSPVIQNLGEVNMGDYNELVKFVKWAAAKYPAKHYMLDVWNHGAGWKLRYDTPVYRGVSYDDHPWGYITTRQMGEAAKQIKRILGKNLDILGYDCCLMQMAEVAYQVMGYVDYHVASEETEPGDGWRYDTWLRHVVKTPSMSAGTLASKIVAEYVKSYSFMFSVTQSSVKPRSLNLLGKRIKKLVDILKKAPGQANNVAAAQAKVQKFYDSDYVDLYHLMDLLKENINIAAVRNAVNDVIYTKSSVVHKEGHKGWKVGKSQGLAIYFPPASRYRYDYEKLAFAEDTGWGEFLKTYFDARLADSFGRLAQLAGERKASADKPEELDRITYMERETKAYVEAKLAEKLQAGDYQALEQLTAYIEAEGPGVEQALRPVLDVAREQLTNMVLGSEDALKRADVLRKLMKVNDLMR